MANVSVQMLDIGTPQFSGYHKLQVLGGTVRIVIPSVQDAIFKEE